MREIIDTDPTRQWNKNLLRCSSTPSFFSLAYSAIRTSRRGKLRNSSRLLSANKMTYDKCVQLWEVNLSQLRANAARAFFMTLPHSTAVRTSCPVVLREMAASEIKNSYGTHQWTSLSLDLALARTTQMVWQINLFRFAYYRRTSTFLINTRTFSGRQEVREEIKYLHNFRLCRRIN